MQTDTVTDQEFRSSLIGLDDLSKCIPQSEFSFFELNSFNPTKPTVDLLPSYPPIRLGILNHMSSICYCRYLIININIMSNLQEKQWNQIICCKHVVKQILTLISVYSLYTDLVRQWLTSAYSLCQPVPDQYHIVDLNKS